MTLFSLLNADSAGSYWDGITCMLAGAASSRCDAHFVFSPESEVLSQYCCGWLPPLLSADHCRGDAMSCYNVQALGAVPVVVTHIQTQLWPCHMPRLAPRSRRPSAFNSEVLRCSSDSDTDIIVILGYERVISQLTVSGRGPCSAIYVTPVELMTVTPSAGQSFIEVNAHTYLGLLELPSIFQGCAI